MFPRETEALYIKKPAPAAPAPQPVVIKSPYSNGTPHAAPAAPAARRFFITINSHRSEVLVEEIA